MRTLLIDDCREIQATVVARTFAEGIKALKEQGPFDLLYLDHDLGWPDDPIDGFAATGYGIMCFLEANPQYLPKEIKFVTSNPVGRANMMAVYRKLYE